MKKYLSANLLILGVLTMITYIPTFIWMVQRWTENDTYYSHGFLVLPISIFIVWLKRDGLAKLPIKPLPALGWPLFICGIAVHAVSALVRVYFTSGFSFMLVIVGLVVLFLGKEYLKQLVFPIVFLFFMLPLPLVAIANISFRLKILAAAVATKVINAMGVPAIRDGSVIKTMHTYLVVEDPCSGIRSLIALIALGALMAYFSHISRARKMILFLSSIPIAVATNIIRIVALGLVSEIYGSKYATGLFHDTMGILVFVFAFLMLSLVGKLLE